MPDAGVRGGCTGGGPEITHVGTDELPGAGAKQGAQMTQPLACVAQMGHHLTSVQEGVFSRGDLGLLMARRRLWGLHRWPNTCDHLPSPLILPPAGPLLMRNSSLSIFLNESISIPYFQQLKNENIF